jgi:hypothetical protein
MNLPPEFVGICVGVGGFGLISGYLGYKLRQIIERMQAQRANRITKRDLKVTYGHNKITRLVDMRPPAKPEFVPLEAQPQTHWSTVSSADRDEVISALTGCGYKKTAAATAADACSVAERADLASWIRAALKHTK